MLDGTSSYDDPLWMERNAARAAEKAAAIPEYPRHGKTDIQPTKAPQTAPNVQRLVDIEQKKAEGKGRGYERWATMHNLKQMAATLNVYQEYGFTSSGHRLFQNRCP